jgi:hypothetical protein
MGIKQTTQPPFIDSTPCLLAHIPLARSLSVHVVGGMWDIRICASAADPSPVCALSHMLFCLY